MKTAIVACRTLERETQLAIRNAGVSYPILWIESGLHSAPKKFASKLQEILDSLDAGRVLAVLGFCGNCIQAVKSDKSELIIPRVDDCISLLLGSVRQRREVSGRYAAYFLTEGWLDGERNLWAEYRHSVEKYGREQAQTIAKMMLGNYRTLGLLDSGASPIAPLVEKTKIIADTFGLAQKVIPASTAYIERLLTGPWPEDMFLIKAPGQPVTAADLLM